MDAYDESVMRELEAEANAFRSQFVLANLDLVERAGMPDGDIQRITADYDDENDIFMLWFGEPVEAITQEADGAPFYLRLAADSLRVVGLEVLNASTLTAPYAEGPAGLWQNIWHVITFYGPGTHDLGEADAAPLAASLVQAMRV